MYQLRLLLSNLSSHLLLIVNNRTNSLTHSRKGTTQNPTTVTEETLSQYYECSWRP